MFAARVLKAMKEAQSVSQGAIGLDGKMLDAPMIKQVFLDTFFLSSVIEKVCSRPGESLQWRRRLTLKYLPSFNYWICIVYEPEQHIWIQMRAFYKQQFSQIGKP